MNSIFLQLILNILCLGEFIDTIRIFSRKQKMNRILMIGLTPGIEGGSQRHIYEISSRINCKVLTQRRSICKNKIEIPILSEKFKIQFPPDFSLLTYYVDYFQPSTSLWPVITEIKRTSKVGLLTNMYVGMLDLIRDRNLLPSIDWDVVIDSSKVDLQKPDPKIYLLAQKLSGVENGEILFVDNSKKNIDAAKNLGWTIFYFGSSDYEKSSSNLLEFYRNLPL